MDKIENSLIEFHSNLIDQVQLKNIDPKVEIEKSFESIQKIEPDPKGYIKTIKRLADLLNIKKEQKTLSEQDILNSIKVITQDLSTNVKKNMD